MIVVFLLACTPTATLDSGSGAVLSETSDIAAPTTPATPATPTTPTTPTMTTPTTGSSTSGTADTGVASPPLPVCINELMPSNTRSLELDGAFPDWIELYNPGPLPVDLAGYTLSDDPDDPVPHVLPSLRVPPGGARVLYADEGSGPDHLPFRLAAGGDAVVLGAPWGRRSVVRFGALGDDVAAARSTDCCEGACWSFPFAGTPGETNVVPDPPILVATTPVSRGSSWRWWTGPEAPPPDWTAVAHDDGAWDEGVAPLGYGDAHIVTVLPYGDNPGAKWPAAYFRAVLEVPDAAAVESVELQLMRDDGAAVYLNGLEVARSNLPEGPLEHGTLALGAAYEDETAWYRFDVEPELLRDGTNVLAVELHQATAGSSDLGFDLELALETWVPVD